MGDGAGELGGVGGVGRMVPDSGSSSVQSERGGDEKLPV